MSWYRCCSRPIAPATHPPMAIPTLACNSTFLSLSTSFTSSTIFLPIPTILLHRDASSPGFAHTAQLYVSLCESTLKAARKEEATASRREKTTWTSSASWSGDSCDASSDELERSSTRTMVLRRRVLILPVLTISWAMSGGKRSLRMRRIALYSALTSCAELHCSLSTRLNSRSALLLM
eukprot:748713-Hanusia_phi.AAC.3